MEWCSRRARTAAHRWSSRSSRRLRPVRGSADMTRTLRHAAGVVALTVASLSASALNDSAARTTAERATLRHFNSIRNTPSRLLPFLREMPKGGDLHNHLYD